MSEGLSIWGGGGFLMGGDIAGLTDLPKSGVVQFSQQNDFLTCSWRSQILYIRAIRIQIGKNNWYLETYGKS